MILRLFVLLVLLVLAAPAGAAPNWLKAWTPCPSGFTVDLHQTWGDTDYNAWSQDGFQPQGKPFQAEDYERGKGDFEALTVGGSLVFDFNAKCPQLGLGGEEE